MIAERIGFGCAGLFALPSRSARRALLEHAYDVGIRYFDVAPIYGLGRAEAELARFRRQHPDIRVATKFGLTLTSGGRVAGLVQRPVRAVLNRQPGLRDQAKASGRGPDSGLVGGSLYRTGSFSVDEARAALRKAQRILGVERIDTFLAHEPALNMEQPDALIDFLNDQQQRGSIGAWGPAGELPTATAASTPFYAAAPVVQRPYNLNGRWDANSIPATANQVLFGILAGALPALRRRLHEDPVFSKCCVDALGRPLVDNELPQLLLRDAIRASDGGRVLVSTTNARHLSELAAAAASVTADELAVIAILKSALNPAEAAS